VAVLEVDLQASGQFDPCSLVLFQLSEGQHLKRGDIVVALGNPQGIGWGMSVTPEAIGSVEHDKLLFQSTFLSPGHSGGALLDGDGRIIGMIQSDQQPYGVARRLSAIIPELRSWNYVVELYQESPMPKYPRYLFESVLEEAVAQGDLTVVNKLAEACPLDDFGFGRTPLHIGAMHGQTGVVSRLLALGANPNVRANDYAVNGYTPLHLAAEHGHTEVVEVLLAAGADAKISTRSQTPVHLAVESGHIDVVKALARNQGLVEKEGLFGRTPLALAIMKKRLDIIAALLAAGASPNARDQEGRTPLHVAVRDRVFDAVPMLLQAGADAEATDTHGKKPLDMVSDRVKRREVAEMFRTAERDKRRQR
jgi:ankyrin repeat protein